VALARHLCSGYCVKYCTDLLMYVVVAISGKTLYKLSCLLCWQAMDSRFVPTTIMLLLSLTGKLVKEFYVTC